MTLFQAHALVSAERQAWRAYETCCLDWRRKRNYPANWVFYGDMISNGLWLAWQVARNALFALRNK